MRLLVVEDDRQLRDQLAQGLIDSGFVVDVAGDGREGLYYATEYDYDLAIIDLGLPEIAGIDLVIALREAQENFPFSYSPRGVIGRRR